MHVLKTIFAFLKGVVGRMIGASTIKQVYGSAPVTLSAQMIDRIDLWQKMLEGKAPWCDPEKLIGQEIGVVSLGIEDVVCEEFANTVLSEFDSSLENEQLNEIYQKGIVHLNENLQEGIGLGAMVIKPIGTTGDVEFITADRIIPREWNADHTPRWVDFIQVKEVGETDVYYRIESHRLSEEGLTITNRAFKGTDGNVGREIPLTSVEEWSTLPESVTYPGMDRMDFGYYRNPIPNRIDHSEVGVSIFEKAVRNIRKCDIQASRLDWEMQSGERAVFADYTSVRGKDGKYKIPAGKKRLFVGLDMQDEPIHDFSPAFRDQSMINVLDEYKRHIEDNCCLAYGDLAKDGEIVAKTATEIQASKTRKFNMVNAIQNNLRTCLEGFAYGIAFYQAQYTKDLGFMCTFNDSVLNDEDKERNNDRLDLAAGIMSPLEYRMKWYGEDEKTAAQNLPAVDVPDGNGEEPM